MSFRNPQNSDRGRRRRASSLAAEPLDKSSCQQLHDNSADLEETNKSPKSHQQPKVDNIFLHDYLSSTRTDESKPETPPVESSGRERLKRHRTEVAGRVLIPDNWSQEELLKDWIDYSTFDALLAPSGIGSAREALVAEGRRASAGRLRIESRC